jgi:4-amino-4-deoxy-L-arabinose transferase-like glycosyltransferase
LWKDINSRGIKFGLIEFLPWLFLVVFLIYLAFYNLTDFPLTWYDEGSHLHVPKTLMRFGVYADYSSEGFRYFGPTIGIGPTVLLPIAAMFKLFGIGMFQARLIMAIYLILAVIACFSLAKIMGGTKIALVAILLLISTRSLTFVELGRNVLGEVPGLFFLTAGLAIWFAKWDRSGWGRLVVVGLLLGLSMVTKYQYLIVIIPALGVGWVTNMAYYKSVRQNNFIVPGLVAVLIIGLWQIYQVVYLGPSTIGENLRLFREFTSGAAAVFSPDLIRRGINELLDFKTYGGALVPVLVFGGLISLPRNQDGQRWGLLFSLVMINLVWYVFASISWLRYAFPALSVAALFVAKFFSDLTEGYHIDFRETTEALRGNWKALANHAPRIGLLTWLGVVILAPMVLLVGEITNTGFNSPEAVAQYLEINIPQDRLIETFEPELGFLTDHNYHFPPQIYLLTAVRYIWAGGPSPSLNYDFLETERPDYVIVGEFGRWVDMYPPDKLQGLYRKLIDIDKYEIYQLIK